MHGRANEIKTDLLEYGAKLIDNSISDKELETFFEKYNGRNSHDLDIIMKTCFRYLEPAQIYQLCKRLIPLEARYNHKHNAVFRNKTPASACMTEFMARIGHSKKIYKSFTESTNPEEFVKSKIDMNYELGCLYALLITQDGLNIIPAKDIGYMYVFHAICTPVNELAGQLAEQEDLLQIAANTRLLLSSKENAFIRYFSQIFNEISWHPHSRHEMPLIKKKEDIQYDKERFIQEMSCISDCGVVRSFTTWPLLAVKVEKTPQQEDYVQQSIFLSTLRNLNLQMNDSYNDIGKKLDQTVCMITTVLEKHQHWIDNEVLKMVSDIFLKSCKHPAMANQFVHCNKLYQQLKQIASQQKGTSLTSHL